LERVVSDYEAKRTEFLANLKPGDFVNWVTFDGSSVHEVHSVTDDEIVLCGPDGTPGVRWPRSGIIHHDAYGGYDDHLSPPGKTQFEYFLRRRHRHGLEASTKGMDAQGLGRVAEFAADVKAGVNRRTLSTGELRKIADLLDAGEEAFRALERITGKPAPLSGGSEVQDTLRAMAGGAERDAVLDVLATTRVVLWFCPADHTHRVEWTTNAAGMTPHCVEPGCGQMGEPR